MGEISSTLLQKWHMRVKRAQLAHRFASKGLGRLHLWLGIPTIMLSSIVAALVFASWEADFGEYGRLAAGMLSVSAATLAALQTFLRFEELSEKHQIADAQYGAVRLKIEHLQAFESVNQQEMNDVCREIRHELEKLARETPIVSERFWLQSRAVLARNNLADASA